MDRQTEKMKCKNSPRKKLWNIYMSEMKGEEKKMTRQLFFVLWIFGETTLRSKHFLGNEGCWGSCSRTMFGMKLLIKF